MHENEDSIHNVVQLHISQSYMNSISGFLFDYRRFKSFENFEMKVVYVQLVHSV